MALSRGWLACESMTSRAADRFGQRGRELPDSARGVGPDQQHSYAGGEPSSGGELRGEGSSLFRWGGRLERRWRRGPGRGQLRERRHSLRASRLRRWDVSSRDMFFGRDEGAGEAGRMFYARSASRSTTCEQEPECQARGRDERRGWQRAEVSQIVGQGHRDRRVRPAERRVIRDELPDIRVVVVMNVQLLQ